MESKNKKTKTILVTGGAGFIGSHLCGRLARESKNRVISLDNYFAGTRSNHVQGVEYREGHTKDVEQLVPETIDLIYHLGEYARVESSFEDIASVWDLNIAGTFGVLEMWRKRGGKLVYAGSSTKFADGGLGRDQSPYAWTKASNTDIVRNYGGWFGLLYAITYFYNVYGPGERAEPYGTVIEIFKRQRAAGAPLTVRSPGTQRRNFTHVDDIVRGLILIGEQGLGDEYGLGSEESYSIREVAEMFGSDIRMLPERKGNRMDGKIDTTRMRSEFGWEAERSIKDYISAILASKQ
ncbi:NAD-dependent epimerase/dehydratase family protein [bacterium]|nr:NAD-dependent epimerase/dehydratase family protein [bacterium]